MSAQHPRLRVTPTAHGIPVEINGVTIPVTDWSMGPGGFEFSEGTLQIQMNFNAEFVTEPEPETAEQRGARLRAKEAAELATLTAEWQSARNVHAGSPAVLAVLDLHQPHRRYAIVQCDHCQTDSDSPETDHAPWPCATYTALTAKRGLPRIGDAVHIVEGGNCAISPVVGHIGDRAPFGDHGIIVTPGGREAEWLPTHQDETRTVEGSWHWPCSTEVLAGSEPNAPAPVTVNITVQGGQPAHAAINKQLLAEYRAYPSPFRR